MRKGVCVGELQSVMFKGEFGWATKSHVQGRVGVTTVDDPVNC